MFILVLIQLRSYYSESRRVKVSFTPFEFKFIPTLSNTKRSGVPAYSLYF